MMYYDVFMFKYIRLQRKINRGAAVFLLFFVELTDLRHYNKCITFARRGTLRERIETYE